MTTMLYRSCEISGSPAAAVLEFRESVAAAAQAVIDELNNLNNVTADRIDDDIVLTGQVPSQINALPVAPPVLHSQKEQQGTKYRAAVERHALDQSRQPSTGTLPGVLVGAGEQAIIQYSFAENTPSAALLDSSVYGKTASPVTTVNCPQTNEGPLGYSRVLSHSSDYWMLPTGQALLDNSVQQTMIKGAMSCWAWVKPADHATEQVIACYGSPPISEWSGTVTLSHGVPSVLGTGFTAAGFVPYDRLFVDGGPVSGYIVKTVVSDFAMILFENAPATLTDVTAYRAPAARPFSPEARNTLYRLSINTAGQAQAYWEYGLKQPVTAVNTGLTVPAGQFAFVGMNRNFIQLGTGSTGLNILNVMTGSITSAEAPVGSWVQVEGLGSFKVFGYGFGTVLVEGLTVTDATERKITILNTSVSVGRMDGSFITNTTMGLHPPTGGNEPQPGTFNTKPSPDTLGALHIARDPATLHGFTGAMSCFSLFNLDLAPTSGTPPPMPTMQWHYSRAFPDFILSEKGGLGFIRRSQVSDIPDGATVYAQYKYSTSPKKAMTNTDQVTAKLDGLVGGLGNPAATSISKLSQSINAPDPAQSGNISQLSSELLPYGLMAGGGKIVPQGAVDIGGFASLQAIVGLETAMLLTADKPNGWIITVASTEERTLKDTVDACGVPSSTVIVTEKIMGINRNLHECAVAAGVADVSQLRVRVWWVGAPTNASNIVARERSLGLTNSQQADAYAKVSSDNFIVAVIKDVSAPATLVATLGPAAFGDILTRPTIPVNPAPTPADIAAAVTDAIQKGPGQTIDGDDNGQDPALLVGSVADFDLMLGITELINSLSPNLAEEYQDCVALIAVLEDLFKNIMKALEVFQKTVVPLALHQRRSSAACKQALSRYIPCVGAVALDIASSLFHDEVNVSQKLMLFGSEQQSALNRQVSTASNKFSDLLCIPRTLLAALRGGVCGIQIPKSVAGRQCPSQIDMMMDRLQQLVELIEVLIKQVINALSSITVDMEVSIGAANKIALDFQIPCLGPVSKLLRALK